MSQIYNNLYLGNINTSRDQQFFQKCKIKNVLICAKNLKRSFNETCKYHQLQIMDTPTTIILKNWPESIEFIENCEGNILVHCLGGKSRSASTVMAYVMFKENLTSEQSIEKVRKLHKFAYPNSGFLQQLIYWDEILQEYRKQIPLKNAKQDYNLLTEITSTKLNEVSQIILNLGEQDLEQINQQLNQNGDLICNEDDLEEYTNKEFKKQKNQNSFQNTKNQKKQTKQNFNNEEEEEQKQEDG